MQSVELRLADYGMTTLQVVSEVPLVEPVPVHDSPQGRAFGAQEPYVQPRATPGPATAHLPVTVRGDRLGVLTVTAREGGWSREGLAEMQQICEALGHEILVAERDTDLYLLARRATRLTLAAEMQWQLLPGRSVSRPEFSLGAHLEPAYAIFGDNFDWSVSAQHLTLTVTNGMGKGIEAALMTNLVVNALRNARRAGLDLAGQASLADQAVYAQYRGELYAAVLLLRFDLATGGVEAVDAGSPRMWRLRGRKVESVEFDAQLPLGMFEETEYVTERLRVEPGDRMLIGSDGVYGSASAAGEHYGTVPSRGRCPRTASCRPSRCLSRCCAICGTTGVPRRWTTMRWWSASTGSAGSPPPATLACDRSRPAGRPASIRSTARVSPRRCPVPRLQPRCGTRGVLRGVSVAPWPAWHRSWTSVLPPGACAGRRGRPCRGWSAGAPAPGG